MVLFFKNKENTVIYVIEMKKEPQAQEIEKLSWLLGGAERIPTQSLEGCFVGPRKEMLTPWSTNAVEITQNMGLTGIIRMEEFFPADPGTVEYDRMLQHVYKTIDQGIYKIDIKPEPVLYIENIDEYNKKEGLALSDDEIEYLNQVSRKMGRKLTDSEVFGFSQVNSEHCRHKIFNGTFVINGQEMEESLFTLIRKTTNTNKNRVVSAYKDNVAFLEGPKAEQFAPANQETADFFQVRDIKTDISLKAETHNFPTTVEPFYGASTGSGGEIRDRMAGGKASVPMAGTAVYMTGYPRMGEGRSWEKRIEPRKWLYQTPMEILIKASNGASDFGNKFGQPLICGSLLTFEHEEGNKTYGYDKVIMLAGGIGYAKAEDSLKDIPEKGDKIVLLGGDNYRIGMGGGAVSSVATGEYSSALELNAVQRANPEMQKRVFNTIRAYAESENNCIVSNHDHGAGGHLNCLSELVENNGGLIDMTKIPVGDPTLSDKEIIGNESQERMGLVMREKDIASMQKIADRERSPMYVIGDVTGDMNFCFVDKEGQKPMDIKLEYMFGKPPKTVLTDTYEAPGFSVPEYSKEKLVSFIKELIQIEAVACKDWLTNKVDRSVTGKVAFQQTAGEIQLPVNNLGAVAIDFRGERGIATSIGHAPVAGLVDSEAGAVLSVTEALTNLVWAPVEQGLKGVSLSANWMWPCKNPGEDARLYKAVKGVSDFAIALGINIPTGKDSLSMVQKYPDGKKVFSPGTVIISTVGEVTDVKKIISPVMVRDTETFLLYVDFSGGTLELGGSSFSQIAGKIGGRVPEIKDAEYFGKAFTILQNLIEGEIILAGHDISAGGLVTTLLEMNFPNTGGGMAISLDGFKESDMARILFSEKPSVVIQIASENLTSVKEAFATGGIDCFQLGSPVEERILTLTNGSDSIKLEINELRELWYKTSYLLDRNQSLHGQAEARFKNYAAQPLKITMASGFTGSAKQYNIDPKRRTASGLKAAIIREKGINGDREMAYSLYYAGFDVKDVHMTDLITGRETLEEISYLVFPGGFSNSDVLGSAKGWAGAFIYNEKAKAVLENFYKRQDTLSLGVCNGCQLVVELGLIYPDHQEKPKMLHNDSHKFESTFLSVEILANNSVMLKSLAGSSLGIWVAHGEGKFSFPYEESRYHIPLKYSYNSYPGNPNGSQYNTAGICSADGRHLAMMPHLERAIFPWQWPHYPRTRKGDTVSPWIEAFVNAKEWIKERK